jgi:FMN phosphatase YigB (HAD superfamily)
LAAASAILYPKSSSERSVTLTLLVDLDNTLLSNDMSSFLPAYLQALGQHLVEVAPSDHLIPTLIAATHEMVRNNRPDRSLKHVFDAAFYPALGKTEEDLKEQIDSFYAEVFPKLEGITQPRPEAIALVQQAFERGYEVVVATSPLFPLTAIQQRLNWAGLSLEEFPFTLVSSYESFHFAKPNPAYYAEILARLGWPEKPAVMVGDDPYNDILPSQRLGLPVYWVADPSEALPEGVLAPNARGGIEGVLPWIDSVPESQLQPVYQLPEAFLAILRSTPACLASLGASIPEPLWSQSPQEGEWNLTEILCHLRDVEGEVNLTRVEKVLKEQNPFLPGMDTDPWAEERLYFCQNGPEALRDFMDRRIRLLELLQGLEPQDWDRKARHAIFGPTTLREIVSIFTSHDRLHVRQVHGSIKSLTVPLSW